MTSGDKSCTTWRPGTATTHRFALSKRKDTKYEYVRR